MSTKGRKQVPEYVMQYLHHEIAKSDSNRDPGGPFYDDIFLDLVYSGFNKMIKMLPNGSIMRTCDCPACQRTRMTLIDDSIEEEVSFHVLVGGQVLRLKHGDLLSLARLILGIDKCIEAAIIATEAMENDLSGDQRSIGDPPPFGRPAQGEA